MKTCDCCTAINSLLHTVTADLNKQGSHKCCQLINVVQCVVLLVFVEADVTCSRQWKCTTKFTEIISLLEGKFFKTAYTLLALEL